MKGDSHRLVVCMAIALMEDKARRILLPRWLGIDGGAVLSDEMRIMWEPDLPGSKERSLVHRCFIDSDNPKDHGCIQRALDHGEGTIQFIRDFADGKLGGDGGYTEDSFLENLGMFLGIASHHIADLCTPVHVGSQIDLRRAGFRSKRHLHNTLESDFRRLSVAVSLQLRPPEIVTISRQYFWNLAEYTYRTWFVRLEELYANADQELLARMVSDLLSRAILTTRDLWHTIIHTTKMTDREWSYQPLL